MTAGRLWVLCGLLYRWWPYNEKFGASSTGVKRRYATADATVVMDTRAFGFPTRHAWLLDKGGALCARDGSSNWRHGLWGSGFLRDWVQCSVRKFHRPRARDRRQANPPTSPAVPGSEASKGANSG